MGESHPTSHKPRLAWFTPFTKRSAIGACSKRAVERLAETFEVEVWSPDLGDSLETTVACKSFPALEGADASQLDSYAHVVYNFGNNYEFHGGIWKTCLRRPGVAVLHDAVMYHFFAELHLEVRQDLEAFLALFHKHYGPEAATAVSRSLRRLGPPISETGAISDWSLLEAAVGPALGVIVHSEYCRAKIDGIVECPITKADLPVELATRHVLERSRLGVPSDHVLIVIAGGLNRNKRADSVIRALGSLGGRASRTTLALVGWIDEAEAERLKDIARSVGVGRSLLFTGFASDEEFYSYLAHADICVNLRYPNTEGASASVIEEMLSDNAVVVLDTGVFRELPDHAVSRVRLAYEQPDLVRALRELIDSPERRSELAVRARNYAEATYRADLYAEKVDQILQASARSAPLLRLADRVAGILSEIACESGSSVIETVARCIDETFLREPEAGRTAGAPVRP